MTHTSGRIIIYDVDPEKSVNAMASIQAGTAVFTLENAEHNWCRISAGGYTGYIKVECLKTVGDQDLKNQEFEQNMSYNHMLYDEIEQLEEQETRTKIWEGIVLGLILIAFVAGYIFVKMRIKK